MRHEGQPAARAGIALAAALVVSTWSAPPTATAQARAPAQAEAGQPEPPKVKVERGAGGRKVYRITEEIRIEGKIQKPEAFYVLQKSSINYEWTKLKKDFVPKILDSVANAPF